MAANTTPIFSIAGNNASNNATAMAPTLTTAAADYTGVSANNALVFTAGANGSYVTRLRFKAIGTNVATVARIYLNNGAVHTTAANNSFYGEITLAATTASAVAATAEVDYYLNFAIPANWTIWVGLGTTVAAGWVVTPVAGNY